MWFRKPPPIRLPLTVVVLSPNRTRYALDRVDAMMGDSVLFWDDVGITLQPTVRGLVSPNTVPSNWGDFLHDLHRWEIGTPKPTIYVMSGLDYIVGLGLGAAWPHLGLAVVAGMAPGASTDKLINHELSHLCGLGHDAPGEHTFMAAALETSNRVVSTKQKLTILENAHRLGGF